MIGKTNVQSSVTENTVKDWGFTKSNLTSVDIEEEVVESPEMEYATKGYVDKALAEHTTPEAELVVRIKQDGDNAELSNVKAKVTYGSKEVELSSGAKVLVPVGEDVTVEFPKLEGYKRPDTIKLTMSENGNTVNAVYKGALVTLNVSTYDGKSADGQVVTVQKTVTIDCTPDYDRIDELGVAIMDIYGKFYRDADEWIAAGRPVPNGVAVSDGTHRFCIAMQGVEAVSSLKTLMDQDIISLNASFSYNDIQTWGFPYLTTEEVFFSQEDVDFAKKNFEKNAGAVNLLLMELGGSYDREAAISLLKALFVSSGMMYVGFDATAMCLLDSFPNSNDGYLGSSGEWYLASTLNKRIDSLLAAIGGKPLSDTPNPVYWTSSGNGAMIDGTGDDAVWVCQYSDLTTYDDNTGEVVEIKSGQFTLAYGQLAAALRAFCTLEPKHQTITTSERLVVKDGKVTFHTPYEAVNSVLLSDMEGYLTPERLEFQASDANTSVDAQYVETAKPIEMTINYTFDEIYTDGGDYEVFFKDNRGILIDTHYFYEVKEGDTFTKTLLVAEGTHVEASVTGDYEIELIGETSFVATDGGVVDFSVNWLDA